MSETVIEARRSEAEDVRTLVSVTDRAVLAGLVGGLPRAELGQVELSDRGELTVSSVSLDGSVELLIDPQPFVRGHADIDSIAIVGTLDGDTLEVEQIRVHTADGAMREVDTQAFIKAQPDPAAPGVQRAVSHLNDDHADALLVMAQVFGDSPDAIEARCAGADYLGLDLDVVTPNGERRVRIMYFEQIDRPGGLRVATVSLAKAAREALS